MKNLELPPLYHLCPCILTIACGLVHLWYYESVCLWLELTCNIIHQNFLEFFLSKSVIFCMINANLAYLTCTFSHTQLASWWLSILIAFYKLRYKFYVGINFYIFWVGRYLMSFVKAKNKCVNFVQCFEENKTIGAKQLSCGKRWVAF